MAPRGCRRLVRMVGLGRLELPTSRLSSARSNQLSYKPETVVPKSCDDFRSDRARMSTRKIFLRAIPRRGLVHERKRKEDGGVLPMDLTDPETGWP